jgi:hypothetical protein
MNIKDIITESYQPARGDVFFIEAGDLLIETQIVDILDDGIVVDLDLTATQMLAEGAQEYRRQILESGVAEAKYQGREVPLGKPMKGDVKKSKVYVRGPKGNVVKVNFGDKKMRIKKSNPQRRKNFRARHRCANPGPRWKARYWSCRAW